MALVVATWEVREGLPSDPPLQACCTAEGRGAALGGREKPPPRPLLRAEHSHSPAHAHRAPPHEGHRCLVSCGGEGATVMLIVAWESEGQGVGGRERASTLSLGRVRDAEEGEGCREGGRAWGEIEGEVRLREGRLR